MKREFEPGDEVNVSYDGYYTTGDVVGVRDGGWVIVRQTSQSNVPYCGGFTYEAAEEFVSHVGEPLQPPPSVRLFRQLEER